MADEASTGPLTGALLVLRITLGLFLLQWGIEKFVAPQMTEIVWDFFYGMSLPQLLRYLFGVVEIAIAVCLFLGLFRTIAYGAALAIHTVSVVVSWPALFDPWGDPVNHLFIAGLPVWGAFAALFLLRRWDRGLLDQR